MYIHSDRCCWHTKSLYHRHFAVTHRNHTTKTPWLDWLVLHFVSIAMACSVTSKVSLHWLPHFSCIWPNAVLCSTGSSGPHETETISLLNWSPDCWPHTATTAGAAAGWDWSRPSSCGGGILLEAGAHTRSDAGTTYTGSDTAPTAWAATGWDWALWRGLQLDGAKRFLGRRGNLVMHWLFWQVGCQGFDSSCVARQPASLHTRATGRFGEGWCTGHGILDSIHRSSAVEGAAGTSQTGARVGTLSSWQTGLWICLSQTGSTPGDYTHSAFSPNRAAPSQSTARFQPGPAWNSGSWCWGDSRHGGHWHCVTAATATAICADDASWSSLALAGRVNSIRWSALAWGLRH